MYIDKVEPFYTEEERKRLAEQQQLLKAFSERMAQSFKSGGEAGLKEFFDRERDSNEGLEEQIDNLREYVEQRYIASFNGDVPAIMADIKEIISSTQKEDYIAYQKRTNRLLKPLLKEEPPKDSPKETKRRYKDLKARSVQGYNNCYLFILSRIRVQLEALEHYHADNAEALELAEARAEEFYKKPKTRTQHREIISIEPDELPKRILSMPSSPYLNGIEELLIGRDPEVAGAAKKSFNRNARVTVYRQDDDLVYSSVRNGLEVNAAIQSIYGNSPALKNMLRYVLIESAKQALYGGKLVREIITFTLRDMVEAGMYRSTDTARVGFDKVTDPLMSIRAWGKISRGKKEVIETKKASLFPTVERDRNGECRIRLNPDVNWGMVAEFVMDVPAYILRLPSRAADLLEYICFLARQNAKSIAKDGYFYISFKAIWYRLGLPDPNTCPNPKRDIKDVIEDAVEQIEEENRKAALPREAETGPEFSMYLEHDPDAPIKTYLNTGRLKVSYSGEMRERYANLSSQIQDKIDQAQKRKDRIVDEAKAKYLAEKMKAEKEN